MRSGLASGSTCTLVPILILSVRPRGGTEDQRAGGEGAPFVEMQFREPHHVEAVFLAGVDDVEPGGKAFGLAAARRDRKLVIDT